MTFTDNEVAEDGRLTKYLKIKIIDTLDVLCKRNCPKKIRLGRRCFIGNEEWHYYEIMLIFFP
jgi:hypothetical protein